VELYRLCSFTFSFSFVLFVSLSFSFLSILDAPTIKLLGAPQIDLEEGKDNLALKCEADANPPASIVWRRAGRSEIASLSESLQLRPVGRRDSGLYSCQAQNSIGSSDVLSVQLDIKCK
jgi:Immunoglobulin domain